jgi:hypothetical protein
MKNCLTGQIASFAERLAASKNVDSMAFLGIASLQIGGFPWGGSPVASKSSDLKIDRIQQGRQRI